MHRTDNVPQQAEESVPKNGFMIIASVFITVQKGIIICIIMVITEALFGASEVSE